MPSIATVQIGRSVSRDLEPCKNGWTNRHAVWLADSGGPRWCITCGSRSLHATGHFWGGRYRYGKWLVERAISIIFVQRNPIRALEERQTRCISVAGNCWKVTKYDARILWLTVSPIRSFWTPLVGLMSVEWHVFEWTAVYTLYTTCRRWRWADVVAATCWWCVVFFHYYRLQTANAYTVHNTCTIAHGRKLAQP